MQNTWGEARAICRSFDLELMTLESLNEAKSFLTMADNHNYFRSFGVIWIVIDGTTLTAKSLTDWYWPQTGKKISFPMPWGVSQPSGGTEFCLSFGRLNANEKFGLNDLRCSEGIYPFMCQRFDIFIP